MIFMLVFAIVIYFPRLVDSYINGLEISEHKKKQSKNCSGGTKRKLSYIISMMGKLSLFFLQKSQILFFCMNFFTIFISNGWTNDMENILVHVM